MKNPRTILTLAGLLLASLATPAASLNLLNDAATGEPGKFAAAEIRREASAKGLAVSDDAKATRIAITVEKDGKAAAQSYSIQVQNDGDRRVITVRGADANGAMYGGLDIAEAIRTGTFDALKDSDHTPYIKQRGIKFNIPLDARAPTYSGSHDLQDAARLNVAEMWSKDFWQEQFDDMARHRYNLISWWNMNPFPSIVKVPEFPSVALDDVQTTSANGEIIVVKKMTIDEKIQFLREVMQMAKDRGVDIYVFTWNVYLAAAKGKDGLTDNKTAPRTIEYYRSSVREMIKTYPLLAGIGTTAGEYMNDKEFTEMSQEQWLWQTYGEGIRDGLKDTPDRKFRFIQRSMFANVEDIQKLFGELPCPIDISFKYSVGHMYSITNPKFIKRLLPSLSPKLRSWLTIRNDDIHSFRWADVDYARDYIKNIPGEDKIAGFYMGPDGYIWGRDFITKNPDGQRQTIIEKMWLSFALWGRLAYDPELPAATFERLAAARFPGADAPKLIAAWSGASMTFPYITRFFWGGIDIKWFPEACRRKDQFYTVRNFAEGGTMDNAGVLNIMEWRKGLLTKKMPTGVTPLEIAATLESNSSKALQSLPELQRATVPTTSAWEYTATLNDIEAMSHLGLYYAAKIRGACDLALFDQSGDAKQQASAVHQLEAALTHWKNYVAAYTRQYVQPVLYNRAGLVDIPKQTEDVAADVQMARDWKPGTVEEAQIKRSGTEAGFKK
jgi:hypothetical protein